MILRHCQTCQFFLKNCFKITTKNKKTFHKVLTKFVLSFIYLEKNLVRMNTYEYV